MVFQYIKDFKKVLEENIDKQIEQNIKTIDYFVVTSTNDDLTCNIKKLNVNQNYENVKIVGMGLGNLSGIIKLPKENEIVIVGFIYNSEQPVIIGSVFDTLSSEQDNKPPVKQNELFMNNKENGAFIFIDENNDIRIRTPEGAKLKLSNDGSFKLFNKDNYGIECSSSGDITFRDTDGSTSTTSSPGTF